MAQVVVLHPGEMGSAIGAALVDVGHAVYWLPAGRGAATRRRAAQAGLRERDDVSGADVVLSVCPPAAAIDVARSVAGFGGTYVDANAVSPGTAAEVAAIVGAGGAAYVDGGVIGPPPTTAGTTRIYLAGDRAAEVAALFATARVEARLLDGDLSASALKMTYAAYSKIPGALLLAAHGAAEQLGVAEALAQEWALSQPGLAQRLDGARATAQVKGWRFSDEMRQIAETFAAAGQPAGFAQAAAEVFAGYRRPED